MCRVINLPRTPSQSWWQHNVDGRIQPNRTRNMCCLADPPVSKLAISGLAARKLRLPMLSGVMALPRNLMAAASRGVPQFSLQTRCEL